MKFLQVTDLSIQLQEKDCTVVAYLYILIIFQNSRFMEHFGMTILKIKKLW